MYFEDIVGFIAGAIAWIIIISLIRLFISHILKSISGNLRDDAKKTKQFDAFGYDEDGYDRNGHDRNGYDRNGYNSWGYDRDWYDRDGYYRDGYNREGFDKNGHDRNGYDRNGYNSWGYDRNRYDRDGFDKDGYNKDGYDREGCHRDGYDKNGYDKNEFNRDHINKVTNTEFNIHGFNYLGIHKDTGTEYDPGGFNINRINKDNFNVNGIHQTTNDVWNEENFNIFHMHKITGTEYDELGFDFDGIHKETKSTWNPKGFSRDGIHKETEEIYDLQGYDINGNKLFLKIMLKEKNPNLVPFTLSIQQGSDITKELTHSVMSEIEKLNFKKNEDIRMNLELPENNPLFEYEAYLDGTEFSEKTVNSNKDIDLFLEIKRKQLLFGKKSDDAINGQIEEVLSENLYQLLGIEENTTNEQVKKAYYTKIKQFPPNKNPNMFKKLHRAYEFLSDPHLRNKYDIARKYGPQIIKLKELSFQHFEKDEIEKALNTFKNVLEIDKNDEDAMFGIYRCYKKQEEYKKAEKIIQQLIDIDPLNQDYWIEYGFNSLDRISAKATYYDYQIKEKFLAARDLNPINPIPYVGISRVYFEKKEHDTALFWIDKAINADKKTDLQDIELFIMKINILINKNSYRFDEIREVITTLKKLKENDDMFKKYLASELMQIVYNIRREHQFTMSIKLLEEIRCLDRDNNDIGMMIAHEKKLNRAYDAYERFMKSSVATREFQLILTFLVNANLYTEEESAVFKKTYFQQGLRELEGAPINAVESVLYRIRTQYYDLYDYCRDFFSQLERSMQ